MFTFLHRIFVYGYQGKSTNSRSRPQKALAKVTKQTQTLFSTIYPRRAGSTVIISPKVSKVQNIETFKCSALNKTPPALKSEEPQELKMLQEILKVDVSTQEGRLEICKLSDDNFQDSNRSYLFLGEIQDTNEKLYFTLLGQYIDQYLPIIKTPPVVTHCKDFGLVYQKPKGFFINIHNKGHVYDLLKKWPENNIRAIIVTESGRILGQENPAERSAFGMGIPMSKLALYTALAGIKPNQCLPITLDVGTDNVSLLEDPSYIGLRQRRVRGNEYDEFIDEFMDACVQRFGPNTLVAQSARGSDASNEDYQL